MVVPLKANEVVVKAGDSTYLREDEKITGKLVLTNQRVYFIATNGHSGTCDHEIHPSEILEVIFFNTRRFVPNGLKVVMKSGEERSFSVKKRNEFGKLINKMY